MIFDAGVPPYNANQKKKAGTRIELSYFISYGDTCIHRDKSDNFEHYHPSNFHAVFNAKYAYSLIFIFGYRLKAVAQEGRFNRKKTPAFRVDGCSFGTKVFMLFEISSKKWWQKKPLYRVLFY